MKIIHESLWLQSLYPQLIIAASAQFHFPHNNAEHDQSSQISHVYDMPMSSNPPKPNLYNPPTRPAIQIIPINKYGVSYNLYNFYCFLILLN